MSSRKRPADEKDDGQGAEKKAKIDNHATNKEKFAKFYAGLNDKTKAVLIKHLKMSGRIEQLYKIRDQLIDEFHHKKYTLAPGGGGYRCKNKAVDAKCTQLYLGRKEITNLQPFPSSFQNELENVMFDEVKAAHGCIDDAWGTHLIEVYYGKRQANLPAEFLFEDFDEKHWRLSDGKGLVSADIALLNEFGAQFLAFYDTAIATLKAVGRDPDNFMNDRKLVTKYYVWTL